MKKKLVCGLSLLGAMIMSVSATAPAYAAEITDADAFPNGNTSKANVNITDDKDPDGPDGPTGNDLALIKTPLSYDFTTNLNSKGSYVLDADKDKLQSDGASIAVFNNKVDRDWSVTADLDGSRITGDNNKVGTVSSFLINGTEIVGTANKGIVATSPEDKNEGNNSGVITKEVDSAKITFKDDNSAFKAGDKLTGVINYKLYNTADAE